jgi:hypothetical protein
MNDLQLFGTTLKFVLEYDGKLTVFCLMILRLRGIIFKLSMIGNT